MTEESSIMQTLETTTKKAMRSATKSKEYVTTTLVKRLT